MKKDLVFRQGLFSGRSDGIRRLSLRFAVSATILFGFAEVGSNPITAVNKKNKVTKLFRTHGYLLRCPKSATLVTSLPILTAAPFRTPFICHRQRSYSMPGPSQLVRDKQETAEICLCNKKKENYHNGNLLFLVGVTGFEPMASWSRTKRDTKLRHTPKFMLNYYTLSF